MRAKMKRWEKIVCKLFKKVFWSRDRSRGNRKRNLIILLFFKHQKLQSSGLICWQKPFLLEFILFDSTRPKPISSHIETLWVRGLTLKILYSKEIKSSCTRKSRKTQKKTLFSEKLDQNWSLWQYFRIFFDDVDCVNRTRIYSTLLEYLFYL